VELPFWSSQYLKYRHAEHEHQLFHHVKIMKRKNAEV
jgi:hypothetical protein